MKNSLRLTTFLFLATWSGALAQNPGSLDLSFDPGAGANNYVGTTALLSDGRIVIGGGFTSYNGTPRNRIARLNADGSLDASFDPGVGANQTIRTTAIQSDGKILIGGWFSSYDGMPRPRIARLDSDGSLDVTFAPVAGVELYVVMDIAIQSDGKIVFGGFFPPYTIGRLNVSGSWDATFDAGAGVTGFEPGVVTIAIQSDGRIVIGGAFSFYNGTPREHIARLNADGSLDMSFDPGEGASDVVFCTAIQSDGKIIIGGRFTVYNGTPRNGITRLNLDGSLDTTFDPGEGVNGQIETIAIQSDGKIVIGGDFTSYNGIPRNGIARLNVDGSLDLTFDPGSGVGGANSSINATAIQDDGKLVMGGSFTSYNGTPRGHIARLHCEGTIGMADFFPNNFSIFPNPAFASANIAMPDAPNRSELVLRDALGQVVLRGSVTAGRNEVQLSGLAPGVYSVQVNTSTVQRTQWLVKE